MSIKKYKPTEKEINDIKFETLFNDRIENKKLIDKIQKEQVDVRRILDNFMDTMRKEFYSSPNLDNAVESSPKYQKNEGLSNRLPDINNPTLPEDKDIWISLSHPAADEAFQYSFQLLSKLFPKLKITKLYEFLEKYK